MNTLLLLLALLGLLLELTAVALCKKKPSSARYVSLVTVGLHSFFIVLLLSVAVGLLPVLLAVMYVFRILQIARISVARLKPGELYARTLRSTIVFGLVSSLLVAEVVLSPSIPLIALVAFSAFFSALLLSSTLYTLYRFGMPNTQKKTSSDTLPTVSVCIPARNETRDLPLCIESVLASTYPKLEILVLDDCSHDKTPAIIKDYAHRGVRFLSGQEPTDGWLAKNSAMNKLFDESRGEIVVFVGVDVRFSPDTIQQIVGSMQQTGSRMISVLPRRTESHELSVFIQPLRYWWEIAVPRLFAKRPPVLSTAWAVYRRDLKKIGEFDSVKSSVQPETHFAKRLHDHYTFILSGARLGLTSEKLPREQYDTALRTRYPQLKRRPEAVFNLIVLEFIIFIAPLAGILYAVANNKTALLLTSSISLAFLLSTNLLIGSLAVRKLWPIGLISLPFLLLEEWYLLIRSMLAHEFGTITWKERNICLPMLKVEPTLPSLTSAESTRN